MKDKDFVKANIFGMYEWISSIEHNVSKVKRTLKKLMEKIK